MNRFFEGKRVLITGAGGSIGSELARQLAHRPEAGPEKLLLLDCAETPLWQVHRETSASLGERAVPVLASVRDLETMAALLDSERPDVILHAAALKHVPMCEQYPLEAMATNACASARLADLAHERGVSNFTLVSTDKAVAPSCVMGASKRGGRDLRAVAGPGLRTPASPPCASATCWARTAACCRCSTSRSPTDGPVTVTDRDATRFFMTIPEACGLILQATRIAQGGEVYVLDMGEPVRVLDIAHSLIRLYGYEPGKDIEVKIIGLRPGEKLHETLVDEAEEAEPMGLAKLLRIRGRGPGRSRSRCRELVAALEQTLERRDEAAALRVLAQLVPNFHRQLVTEAAEPIDGPAGAEALA